MLNELALLKNGIDEQVLKRFKQHQNIDEPGKTKLVRVVLGECKIIELGILDGAKNKNYWTHGDDNKNQFPAVKLPFPIRLGGVNEFCQWKKKNKKSSPEELMKYLKSLREKHSVEITKHKCWPVYRNKLIEREDIYSLLQNDSSIIHKLIKAYRSFGENGLSLLKEFDECLWQECEKNMDSEILKLMELAIFGGGQELNDKGMIPDGKRITLLLDIENGTAPSAAHRYWVPELSELLFRKESASGKANTGTCAISGLSDTKLVTGTFPKPKCNVLGNVKIFSRKTGVYTYERYGRLAAESYPLSKGLADDFSSALRYLNDKEQGTTWDKLPAENGGNGGTDDLLIAFCRELPDTKVAKLLTYEGKQDDFLDELDYEEESRQICKSFRGEKNDLKIEPRVDFLILRKISDGVQKAIFSSSQPVSQLETASANWNSACKNTPPITLTMFKKSDKVPRHCPPIPISPKEFAFLMRKNYTRSIDGKQKTVPGSAFPDVMAIFLDATHAPELAKRLLPKLLKQFANLLENIAIERSKNSKTTIKYYYEALRTVTAMSLLLKKLDRQKEIYMKEIAYKLGQFCAVLDEIHIGYCVSVRQGKIPSRLIGNQAYAAAVVNPKKALEITAQRIAVYKAWATKNSRKEDTDLKAEEKSAKYAYFWLRNNSAEIHQLIPEKIPRSTPESKTELLLGYLAGRPIVKKQTTSTSA